MSFLLPPRTFKTSIPRIYFRSSALSTTKLYAGA